MKAFKVDFDGVTQINLPDDYLLTSDFQWDIFGLGDDHDVWVEDEGLFRAEVALARIGTKPNVPLPAFIFGCEGERTVSATMSLDEACASVEFQGWLR